MPFRLHIDLPLSDDENTSSNDAQTIVNAVINAIKKEKESLTGDFDLRVKVLQYRLANDNDRRIKNYLVKDENNHVSEKKTVVEL